MGTEGDKANVAVAVASGIVVRPNDGQPGILSCCARVGLQRARVEACDSAQIILKFLQIWHQHYCVWGRIDASLL